MPFGKLLFRFGPLIFRSFYSAFPACAANISLTGTFVHDNDVQLFTFNLSSASTVTFQTLGFGGSADNPGGTNAAGQVILPDGFESVLQVYDGITGVAIGGPILPGPDPGCAPRTPDPGRGNFCQDAYGQESLAAGIYLLALTQNPNLPNGNLNDGFFYVDTIPDPNFNSGFVGTFGFQGTGRWAVDILNVDAATAVSEPTLMPLTGALLLAGLGAAKFRHSRRA
jgi:hypothetical protein